MIPNFVLIVGAMKSGTTTLYDYLAEHPQIASGCDKEPGFFAFREKWELGLDWYESRFNYDSNRHQYALDGSTDYAKHPFCDGVAARLAASAPRKFKLIYVMRHPLRRIESQAFHATVTKSEVGQYRSDRKSHAFDHGISPAAITFSLYAHQIDQFAEYYDDGGLLLLTLERLSREPKAVLAEVTKFLEIDDVTRRDLHLNSNSGDSHRVPHSFWHALYRNKVLRSIVTRALPTSARQSVYGIATRIAQPKGRFLLNADEERAITAILRPDLRRLKSKYKIDAETEWGITL